MKKIYLLFLFIALLFACNKDDNEPDSSENQKQTFVIEEANITSVAENSIVLINSNDDLEVNDIIVSGANANAPKGFLRKITGISTENGTLTLNTVRTSLEEGLKYFPDSEIREATFRHTFTDIDETGGKDHNKRSFSLTLEIDESVTVNNTQLTLNGTLEITPTINGQIIIGRNVLGFPVLNTIELLTETQNNLTLTIGSETNGSFDEELSIGSFQGPPITVYLGGFPVVINPTVSLSVGANGQVNASLSYSYNNNSTIQAGILYHENWQFPATNGFTINDSSATATAYVTGNAKAYIKPEFGISLYDEGFVNTGINVKPYVRFEGSISNSGYNYGIYGGISAGAYFNATLFGFNLIDKVWDDLITFAEYEIDSGGASTAYIADLNPLNGATVTQQPINLSWIPYGFNETPTFEVLFGTSANQLVSMVNTIDNFYTLTQTYPNDQYFWKIIARNNANVIIAESEVQNFILNVNIDLPTVTTTAISNITENSALSGGNVTAAGGSNVSVKGVCWSTNPNPTIANNKTMNGSGLGAFTSQLTGLNGNTTYYVRAYATNNSGTAYGNQMSFTTQGSGNDLPTVTTASVSNVTQNSAVSGGNVTATGGSNVSLKGVCWSTNSNPTIANSTTSNGSGLGAFTSQLTGLNGNTTYYVRAYATNNSGTAYGNQVSFTTQGSGNVSPAFNPNPADAATNIPLTGTLSFTPGANTPSNARFKLYFGTNQNPTTSYNLGISTTYNYNNLQENTNYYWKVETVSSTNQVLATSEVWEFKTLADTSGGTYVGNITFYTQQEINDFGLNNYSSVTGNIKIWGSPFSTSDPITNLIPFMSLTSVGGSLEFVDFEINLDSFEGLNNIQSIGGNLKIYGNDVNSLIPFNNLITIGGGLSLSQGYNISNLNGLSNLNSIGSFLSIVDFDLLTNLNELSNVDISRTTGITIRSNDNLTDLSGIFNNVNSTMDNLEISFNNSLLNFNSLSNITHINNGLELTSNPSVTNLDSLENLTFVGSHIFIEYNQILSDFCGITLAITNGFNGSYSVHDNAYNPTQQDIINGNCSQ